jgi:hypothetical protein
MIDWWMAQCSNSIHDVKGLVTPYFCDCFGTSIGCLKVKIKCHQTSCFQSPSFVTQYHCQQDTKNWH